MLLNIPKQWKRLRVWWDSALGSAFLAAEAEQLKKMLPPLFGYHLLVLGEPVFLQCVQGSAITHRVAVHAYPGFSKTESTLTSRHDKLCIASESVDVVYLAQCLAFINNPHEVLRETFRVLMPQGHVIISNFNPWSLWGLWRWCVHYIKRVPWDGHFISVTRLKDWLALLGFDILEVKHYFFRPPVTHPVILQRLAWLEKCGCWFWPVFGGGYVLLAQKSVVTLTPIRPVFVDDRKVLIPNHIEPSPLE